MKYNVLSLGPARMDVFVSYLNQVDEVCSIDRKSARLSWGLAKDSNTITGVAVGGNTGNNAVGLSRRTKSGMVGALGSQNSDKMVLETLQREWRRSLSNNYQ